MSGPLINSPVNKSIEDPNHSKKIEMDNAQYQQDQDKASETIDSTKEWVKDSMSYWEFKLEENKMDKVMDSPYYPLLKRLLDTWNMDEKTFNDSSLALSKMSTDDAAMEMLDLAKDIENSEVSKDIVSRFEGKEKTTTENFDKSDFAQDSSQFWLDLDKATCWLELMLADSYFKIWSKDWKWDWKKDLSTSIDTVVNTMVKNNDNDFKRLNSEIIWNIRVETNLNSKYKLLKELYKEDILRDAIVWGGWKLKEYQRIKKVWLQKEAKKIALEMQDAEKIINNEERESKIAELKKEKQSIISEGKEVDSILAQAEVWSLSWGKLDSWSDSIENKKE